MFGSTNIPGQMQAAWIMSAHKGHETSANESSDKKESNRAKANMLSRAQMAKTAATTQAAKKGTLA